LILVVVVVVIVAIIVVVDVGQYTMDVTNVAM